MKTSKKGISLIVLVITIIVMIILAAAIILSLNGSGIIDKANEAKTKSDIANAKYTVSLAKAEWDLMDEDEQKSIIGGFKVYAEDKLKDAGYNVGIDGDITVSKDGAVNRVYVGEDNRKAIIPQGFTVSTNELEDTVTEGLVIKDASGNEFVWVPVDVPDGKTFAQIFQRTTKYKPNEDITAPSNDYTEPFSKTTSDGITLSLTNDKTGEWKEEAAMKASVEANGGFYIGRYEAGTTTERKEDTDNKTTPLVVQKDKFVYNNVCWGQNMTDTTGEVTDQNEKNQGLGAVELSRNMYKSSTSVVSTLCYGVQWDAALRFIETNVAEHEGFATNSDDKGNYGSSDLEATGYYPTNNIYDMAGNVWEWTMEAGFTGSRVLRGGSFNYPPSFRNSFVPGNANVYYGFRLALYIK